MADNPALRAAAAVLCERFHAGKHYAPFEARICTQDARAVIDAIVADPEVLVAMARELRQRYGRVDWRGDDLSGQGFWLNEATVMLRVIGGSGG